MASKSSNHSLLRQQARYRNAPCDGRRNEPVAKIKSTVDCTPTETKPLASDAGSKAIAKLKAKQKKAARKAKPTKPTYPTRFEAEQKVRLNNGMTLRVGGACDGEDTSYYSFFDGKRFVLTESLKWHAGSSEGLKELGEAGIIVVSAAAEVRKAVDRVKRFRRSAIVTRPGWFGNGFAMLDGRMIIPQGCEEPLAAYHKAHGVLGRGGTLDGWKEQVAAPLAGHEIYAFALMVMFAPALLQLIDRPDNFGFEFAGAPGCGKSTVQLVMTSAAGPVTGAGEAKYWRTLNSTINALETLLPTFNDMPIILDEAGLIPGSGRKEQRFVEIRDMAFRMASGIGKHRLGEQPGPRCRGIYVISTNCPNGSLVGDTSAAEAGAIADRLITVDLSTDRPHGAFSFRPPSYPSTAVFAETLKAAANVHYGHALPAYLQRLVNKQAQDPAGLKQAIQSYMKTFMDKANVNMNDGSQKRVAEAFALVYAAGCLAKKFGVLPPPFRPGPSALAALTLHRTRGRPIISFDDRLRAVLRDQGTIDLADTTMASVTEQQRQACGAFLYVGRSGNRELVVPVEQIERIFPDWKRIVANLDVDVRLKRVKGRHTRDRPVGPGGAQHACYVFGIMDLGA